MKIKQQYEAIKNKMLTITERLKTKLSKTRKEEAEQRIKKYNEELKKLEKELSEQKTTEIEADKIQSYHLHQQTLQHLSLME